MLCQRGLALIITNGLGRDTVAFRPHVKGTSPVTLRNFDRLE